MAKQILTSLDLLSLPSLTTPKTGSVGFGAKSDGLYQKIGSAESKLATPSDIDTAVNELEIGGRNLLIDSTQILLDYPSSTRLIYKENDYVVVQRIGTASFSCFQFVQSHLTSLYDIINDWGQTYILSVDVKTDVDGFKLRLDVRGGGSSQITFHTQNIPNTNNEWQRIFYIFTLPNSGNRTQINFSLSPSIINDGDILYYKNWQLTKGNKAPQSWTPAPEDQVSDWNTTDVTSFSYIKNKPTQLSQFIDNIGVGNHIANTSNPHSVTKAQVGLGNVDNVKQATKSEFDTHTANSTIHITSAERTNWNLAYTNNHTHGNKGVIDALTQGHIDVLNLLSVVDGNIKVDTTLWATGGLSALGLGESGSSGGGVDMLDSWANYTTEKANYYVPASLLVPFRNDTLSRLTSLENGSATSIETTGSGNAITSVSKSGNTLTFAKGSTFSLSTHNHDTVYKPIGYVPSWSEITGKPSTFAPSAHTHTIANVTGLQSALDGKQPTISTGTTSQYYRGDKTWQTLNTSVVPEGNNLYFTNARVKAYGDTLYSLLGHTHTIAQITGLQTALDNKEPVFTKNTAFNKNFGTTAGTVAQGNDSRIINGQTAFGWGDYREYGLGTTLINLSNSTLDFSGVTTFVRGQDSGLTTGRNYYGLSIQASSTYGMQIVGRGSDWHVRGLENGTLTSWSTLWHNNNFNPSDYVPTSRTITAGNGLTGGGALSANRTLALDTSYADNRYVTRTTAQTITGAKTFDANITLGVNKYIQGTDNYTGVWNVNDLLWRFGSSKAGSVSNIRSEKVGIGTDTPIEKLEVTGNIASTGGANGRYSVLTPSGVRSYGAASGWVQGHNFFMSDETSLGFSSGAYASNISTFNYFFYGGAYTDPSVVILPNKNVGIGTITPTYKLDVSGTGRFTGDLDIGTNTSAKINMGRSTYNYITTPTGGGLSIITNGDSASALNSNLIVSPNGNVGVGKGFTNNTTSITAQLHVRGNILSTGNLTASAGVNTPKVDFGNGFTIEPSGTELVFKYNGVIKQRMLSNGTILATGGVTALTTN